MVKYFGRGIEDNVLLQTTNIEVGGNGDHDFLFNHSELAKPISFSTEDRGTPHKRNLYAL
jgi:hypothetical protein